MARIYKIRIRRCKNDGTECTRGGTKNMSMPCKKQTIDCTQQKTLQLFQDWIRVKSLDNSNLCDNSNIQKVQQSHPRNSIASFDIILYFSTSKNTTNEIPGCFSHGVGIVPTELLVSEALQTSFLSDPGAVLAMFHQSGGCWSTIDRNVSGICSW